MKPFFLQPPAIGAMIFLCASLARSAEAQPQTIFNGASPLQWSVRMADSQMARLDGKLAWKPSGGGKWDYTAGLFTLSLLKLNEQIPSPSRVAFVTNAIGSFISTDGKIEGYNPGEFQLDAIIPVKR